MVKIGAYAVVCIVASALGSVVTLAATGSLGSAGAGWIQAISSIAAVIVSLIAVILVKQTLDATTKAVKVTEKIGDQQLIEAKATLASTRQIGDAQIRPWLAIEGCKVENYLTYIEYDGKNEQFYTVTLTLHNFGNTPARFVTLRSHFTVVATNLDGELISINWESVKHKGNIINIPAISQGQPHTVSEIDLPLIEGTYYTVLWFLALEYRRAYETISNDNIISESYVIDFKREGSSSFKVNIIAESLIYPVEQ